MKGTIDDEILRRLYLRIDIFRNSIGDLEAILGEKKTSSNCLAPPAVEGGERAKAAGTETWKTRLAIWWLWNGYKQGLSAG